MRSILFSAAFAAILGFFAIDYCGKDQSNQPVQGVVQPNPPENEPVLIPVSSGPGEGCVTVGTAPFCGGSPSDCYERGKKYCGPSTVGATCITGSKVLCCNRCP